MNQKFIKDLFTLQVYSLPKGHILNNQSFDESILESFSEEIKKSLDFIGLNAIDIRRNLSYQVICYSVKIKNGLIVTKKHLDFISKNISASNVRVYSPGYNVIYIEIPHNQFHLAELSQFLNSDYNEIYDYPGLYFPFGIDTVNSVFFGNLFQLTNMLITGATGQGKSSFIHSILTTFVSTKSPDEVKFVIADTNNEFSDFCSLNPNYILQLNGATKLLSEEDEIIRGLHAITELIQLRYNLLRDTKTNNILEYNLKVKKNEIQSDLMPYLVVIVDDLATLSDSCNKRLEDPITEICRLGKTFGIHMIVCSQSCSSFNLPSYLLCVLQTKISFRLDDSKESRKLFFNTDATKLLGNGDMLFYFNQDEIFRLQAPIAITK